MIFERGINKGTNRPFNIIFSEIRWLFYYTQLDYLDFAIHPGPFVWIYPIYHQEKNLILRLKIEIHLNLILILNRKNYICFVFNPIINCDFSRLNLNFRIRS